MPANPIPKKSKNEASCKEESVLGFKTVRVYIKDWKYNITCHSHVTHSTLRQLLSMGSIGVGLGRTTLTSSLPHSRTYHSSTTRAWTKPATQHQSSGFSLEKFWIKIKTTFIFTIIPSISNTMTEYMTILVMSELLHLFLSFVVTFYTESELVQRQCCTMKLIKDVFKTFKTDIQFCSLHTHSYLILS